MKNSETGCIKYTKQSDKSQITAVYKKELVKHKFQLLSQAEKTVHLKEVKVNILEARYLQELSDKN